MIHLFCDATQMAIAPALGGAIASVRWRGLPLLRPAPANVADASVLDMACFPMLPFANRIANGRFRAGGHDICLPPTMAAADPVHALHGLGWLGPWAATQVSARRAVLRWHHPGGAWPWAFAAAQDIALSPDGYRHRLTITNLAATPMPAGMGLHPFFPRGRAELVGQFGGHWAGAPGGIPTHHEPGPGPLAAPLGSAPVDHLFTPPPGRAVPVMLKWPGHRLTLRASADLRFTHIYVPPGGDFLCIEPVSHIPDAVNRAEPAALTGLRWLAPGATWTAAVRITAAATSPPPD